MVWKKCNIDKSRVVGFPLHIATFIPPFIASVRDILIMAWRDPVVLVAIIGARGTIIAAVITSIVAPSIFTPRSTPTATPSPTPTPTHTARPTPRSTPTPP